MTVQPFLMGSILLLSEEESWWMVLAAFPLIGLAVWGLNAFSLNRLKKGGVDYSKKGFLRRGRLVGAAVVVILILAAILQHLIFD